jgi:hypothetical protein
MNITKEQEAIKYITAILQKKNPPIDFLFKENNMQIICYIYTQDYLYSHDFSNFLIEISTKYLWPKKIYNFIFLYEEKVK